MFHFKIVGGTPQSGKGLCHTCKHASLLKGQNCEERIICNGRMFGDPGWGGSDAGVVSFRVAECRKYHPSNQPWMHEMEQMAWTIEAKKRGPAGFGEAVTSPEMEFVIKPPVRRDDNDSPSD